MTEKDVWKWIISRLDNDIIYKIYKNGKITCPGFRANTKAAVKANRARLSANLTTPSAQKKMKARFLFLDLDDIKEQTFGKMELNELVNEAEKHGVPNILIKLIQEKQEKKAVQFFATLQEQAAELLDVDMYSLTDEGMLVPAEAPKEKQVEEQKNEDTKTEVEAGASTKQEEKVIRKLEQKINNMKDEKEKLESSYKGKLEQEEKKAREAQEKCNELNGKLGEIGKERAHFEDKSNQLEKKVANLQREVKMWTEREKDWNNERKEFDTLVKYLQEELEKYLPVEVEDALEDGEVPSERLEDEEQMSIDLPNDLEKGQEEVAAASEKVNTEVLVIGKPSQTLLFKRDSLSLTFVDGSEIETELRDLKAKEVWVLTYELSNRDKFKLRGNADFLNLNPDQLKMCEDFTHVAKQLNRFGNFERTEQPTYVRNY